MKKQLYFICSFLSLLLILSVPAQLFSQEMSDIYMELISWKYDDGSRELISINSSDNDEGEYLVEGIEVNFYMLENEEESEIGSAISGEDGRAILVFPMGSKFPMDEEGYIQFYARFAGNDAYYETEAELILKDARLELEFAEIDGEKTIIYRGFVSGPEGGEMPLADDDCYLFVPRMFNLLKIEDGWLEEDGEGTMEFPADLVGDTNGVVQVIARIEEHYDYGHLEASGITGWALAKHSEKLSGPMRELWTPIAPMWMIITLIILLTGVWVHYFYAMYQLYKIKQIGKREEQATKA